jgi:hypothetical protein
MSLLTAVSISGKIGQVKALVAKHDYAKACVLASDNNLHAHFGINEFVVPLILSEDMSLVEEYMGGASLRQKSDLIGWLDELASNTPTKLAFFAKKYGLKGIRSAHLGGKPLQVQR